MIKHEDIDEDMLPLEAQVLDDYLIDSAETRDLIPQELDYCFRMGIAGKFGQYYGITPVSLYGFVQAYLRSRKKFDSSFYERCINKEVAKKIPSIEQADKVISHLNFKPNLVSDAIESDEAHREKIRLQAQQVYKEYGIK